MEKDRKDTSNPRGDAAASEQSGGVKVDGTMRSQFRDTIRPSSIRWEAPPVPSDLNINDSYPSNGVAAQDKANGGNDTAATTAATVAAAASAATAAAVAADTDTAATKPAFFLANEGKANLEKKIPPRYPDSKSMPAKPASMHTRSVSWGKREVFQDSNTSPRIGTARPTEDIQLPFLSENPVSPIGEHMLYSSTNKPKSNGKIAVDDVVNRSPMEAEAETYILRAVEERDTLRSRADSSQVLDNVPDEAINNLASESQNADISSTAGSNLFYDRQSSVQGTAFSSRQRPSHHRRSATVEQKLAGLSDAIGAFHDMEIAVPNYQAPPSPLGRARLDTYDVMTEPEVEPLLTAAEIFQQNASILLNRGKNKNDTAVTGSGAGTGTSSNEAPSVTSSKKSSHWNKLRDVVKVMNAAQTKKNDDGVIVGGVSELDDEEVGGSPDQAIFVENIGDHIDKHEDFEREHGSRNQAPKAEKLGNKEKRFFKELEDFFGPRRTPILLYCKVMCVYVFLPVIGVAAILFHLAGNPPTGILKNGGRPINGTFIKEDGAVVDPGTASASWWVSSHIYGRQEIQSAVLSDPS
jgi:hypothetical protein